MLPVLDTPLFALNGEYQCETLDLLNLSLFCFAFELQNAAQFSMTLWSKLLYMCGSNFFKHFINIFTYSGLLIKNGNKWTG